MFICQRPLRAQNIYALGFSQLGNFTPETFLSSDITVLGRFCPSSFLSRNTSAPGHVDPVTVRPKNISVPKFLGIWVISVTGCFRTMNIVP